ncbi:hypothetical protein ACMGE9_10005 [Macrococcus sp. EM39E]|uniref:hypothetical protein n=1 Tax=Macrococcus animalis TaxID=3395467 RepID=UPI0039BDF5C3
MNKVMDEIMKILSKDELKLIKTFNLEGEKYDIISIRNTSKNEVSIKTFNTIYKTTHILKSYKIDYGISYQFKDNNSIHHFDISIEK